MKQHFTIRLEDNLIQFIKEQAKAKNIEYSDFLRECIEHYVSCKVKEKEETKQASLKLIVTKYDGKCSKCNNSLSIGSLAYYGKDNQGKTILVCLDCMVENKSDKALASKYLKMRELNKTIKALRQEAEALAYKLEDLQILNKFDIIYNKIDELSKTIMDYLKNPFSSNDERKALEDILIMLKENQKVTRDIEDFITSRFRMPFKKKKEKIPYEY